MTCVDNIAYIAYADDRAQQVIRHAQIDVAISTALALWQRTSSDTIMGLQGELGDRQYRLAEKVREHAKRFWPYEDAFLNDAFGEPRANPQYEAMSLAWGGFVDDALRRGRSSFLVDMKQRCISVTDCEDNKWKRSQQVIKADTISHADRQAENRADALNDKRYSRQYAALALGRGYLGMIPSYQDLAGKANQTPKATLLGNIARGLDWWGSWRVGEDPWKKKAEDNYPNMPYPYESHKANMIPYFAQQTAGESFLQVGRDLQAGVASLRAKVDDYWS